MLENESLLHNICHWAEMWIIKKRCSYISIEGKTKEAAIAVHTDATSIRTHPALQKQEPLAENWLIN